MSKGETGIGHREPRPCPGAQILTCRCKGGESDPEKHPGQWNGGSLAVGVARLSRNSGSGRHRNPSQGTWPPAQADMALIGNLLQVSGGAPLSKAVLYFQPLSMLRSS